MKKLFIVIVLIQIMLANEMVSINDIITKKGQVRVEMFIKNEPDNENCIRKNNWFWGVEGRCPSRTLALLKVKKSGINLFVPLSAFSDLGEANELRIILIDNKTFKLIITGGDAATSYTAEIVFKNKKIIERRVYSNEFPEIVKENTKYGFF